MSKMILKNTSNPIAEPLELIWCDSFQSKFMGLMGQKTIPENGGILLAETSESRLGTSIHMLFMRFPICTLWLDASYRVVSATLALPWHLAYWASAPAQYVIETHPHQMEYYRIGDQLEIVSKAA